MAQAFPPLGQEYEPFLYAVVCDEGNGMPLTMVSAIARSGADPWKEAARLAKLPKAVALEALARVIPDQGEADGEAIANRLLSLLPSAREEIKLPFVGARTAAFKTEASETSAFRDAAPRGKRLIPVAIALVLALALLGIFRKTPPFDASQRPPAASAPVADKANP
ncbi:hypothetical protein [uncultured Rhodoblastus sp.]|uniref:hypothetical protein n=1 Tax=uncultured Rhodoblastus sp. TaxID=543037 RepID=UPI0025F697EA|nr:hypothetical protein [uncultured Rhodoblastus sp.]